MSPIKHDIRHFHVVVVQKRKRNVQKVSSTCKVVVSPMKPIAFMKFSLPSPSSDLKVPIKLLGRAFTYVLYLYYELQLSFFLVFPISHIFFTSVITLSGYLRKKNATNGLLILIFIQIKANLRASTCNFITLCPLDSPSRLRLF